MRRILFFFFLLFQLVIVKGQQQFPKPFPAAIDSFLNIADSKNSTNDIRAAEEAIRKIDSVLGRYESEYPLFTGVIKLYQAFHFPAKEGSALYMQEGLQIIAGNKKFLADSFAYQLYNLLSIFSESKRINEWQAADSILRYSVLTNKDDTEWAILHYAQTKFNQRHYEVAQYLSAYSLIYLNRLAADDADTRLVKIFAEWMVLKSKVELWKARPYYERPEKLSFNEDFKQLIEHLSQLKEQAVTKNSYGSAGFRDYLRTGYYNTYKNLLLSYAEWTVGDHREGLAILALKRFIFEDLIPDEMNEAAKAGVAPVISCTDLNSLISYLAHMYINTGNGTDAVYVAKKGEDFIENYKQFNEKEVLAATSFLWYLQTIANRVEGKYEASLMRNRLMKKWWKVPTDNSPTSKDYWMWHIEASLQEIYTMIALKRFEEAGDSLFRLTERLEPIENDTISMLAESVQWPQLQFVSMQYLARQGKWQTVKEYLLEVLTILEQKNHWENVPYYYQAQLLYLVSHYRTEGKLLKHVIHNLLFYTGRQLQYTFIMITPEDRMRFYEQKLSIYFDLYHELLFSNLLEEEPVLKEKIIAQSLYLKNSLIDGNIIPEEVIEKYDVVREAVEGTRRFRNETMMLANRLKMRRAEEKDSRARDANQTLWLKTLELADIDSRIPFTGWKKIADGIADDQVYIETVRYTNWLTDSAAMYGAYLIRDGKLNLLQICREDTLAKLLNDPSSSPQTGALASNNSNRSIITKKSKSKKKFHQGDTDKLGMLLLKPIWNHIRDKKEILLVPDGLLNRISLAALQWQQKFLFAYLLVKQLSGSYVLESQSSFPGKGKALVAGGLDYGKVPVHSNINRLFKKDVSWTYLPGTLKEVHSLQLLFESAGQEVTLRTGNEYPDSLRSELEHFDFIHFATHGFYVDSVDAVKIYDFSAWDPEAIQGEPLFRCGIALSGANNPDSGDITETEGHLLGFELAGTDLRKCFLVSLSACETGLGDLRNNLGVDGLSRALKIGGAQHLLISLWKVPDEPTAVFMKRFYTELFRVKSPSLALQATQHYMSSIYPPSDWAAFVLVK